MRIAIVNDLELAVTVLKKVISETDHSLAWVAYNGSEAVEKCREDCPDLVLMDLIMPVMNGTEAISEIMKNTPCAILVVTASMEGNSPKVFEALGAGALDAVKTPVFLSSGAITGAEDLIKRINTVSKLIGIEQFTPQQEKRVEKVTDYNPPLMIAIGASTGGPKAVANIIETLPGDLGAALVLIQHVDASYALGFTEWLDDQTELTVSVAREGGEPQKNTLFVANTNDHLVINEDLLFHYTPHPKEFPFRPSVDIFFQSLAANWPSAGLAVLLTGIGSDGAEGLLALKNAGWHTIAQDRETSIVYGMPKAAAENGAAVSILPLESIGQEIIKFCKNKRYVK